MDAQISSNVAAILHVQEIVALDRFRNIDPIPFALLRKKLGIIVTRILCESPHILSSEDLFLAGASLMILESEGNYSKGELLCVFRSNYRELLELEEHNFVKIAPLGSDYLVSIHDNENEETNEDSITFCIWNWRGGNMLLDWNLSPMSSSSVDVLVALDNERILIGDSDGIISLLDVAHEEIVFRSDTGFSGGVAALVALKDGHVAVSGKMSDTDAADLAIIDISTGLRVMTLEGSVGTIWAIAQLKDGRLASAGRDTIVRLWDIKPLPVATRRSTNQLDRCTRRLFGHRVFVSALVQLGSDKLLSGDGYGYIRMWDLREGFSGDVQPEDAHPVWEIHAHKTRIRSLHVLADNATLISCAVDNRTIRIWDAYTGQHVKMLVGMAAAGGVRQLVLLSDGVTLASISHSEAPIKLWGF